MLPSRCRVVTFGMAVAIVGIVVGCRAKPPRPDDLPPAVLMKKWVEPAVPIGTYPEVEKAVVEGLAAAFTSTAPPAAVAAQRPLNILALSAGGKYGAYSAGVLYGWQQNGTRPVFDVVTGVSSGAILAVYSFLGPKYDDRLKSFFTETTDRDLYRYKPVRYLIQYGAVASAEPFKKRIDCELNDAVMGEIRAAHAAGRRLFIATLNVQSKRLVVWDIGAIASSGKPGADDLVRQIILAACAIPGLTPSVEIDVCVDGKHYKEQHSDGGAVTQSFVRLGTHYATAAGTPWLNGSNLYVIAAGKLYSDPSTARMGVIARVGASVSASLYSLYRTELVKLYALALGSGMTYNLAVLPADFVGEVSSYKMNPDEMLRLWQTGHQQAASGMQWRHLPPGGLTGEEETPRTGTNFLAIPPVP